MTGRSEPPVGPSDGDLVAVLERVAALLEFQIISADGYIPMFPGGEGVGERTRELHARLWPDFPPIAESD